MKKFIMTVALVGFLAIAGTASASTFVYTGGLIKVGSQGSQVSDLQTCMNRLGHSTGVVDGVFGPNTKAGVMSFQASKGVVVDGVIGPVTGPLYTAACSDEDNGNSNLPDGCTSTEGYSTTTGQSCSDDVDMGGDLPEGCTGVDTPMYSPINGQRCVLGEGGSDTGYEGTEGSVDNYSLGTADQTEALEGENDVEIYAVDVELDDLGDLALDRLDVWFANSDGTSDLDPWEYFKSVSVLVDGDEVATQSADSNSDWSDDSDGEISVAGTTKEYRIRFSGLDEVFKSNETTTVSIAVTMQNTIDSTDQSAIWNVEIDDDSGFRWVDGTGFIFTDGASLEDSFTTGNEETASIDLSVSTNNPDSAIIVVNKSSDTNDEILAIYNVEESQDVDVNINQVEVGLAVVDPAGGVTPAGAGTVIRKAYLVVDGDVMGTESVSGSSLTSTITFDNLNWDLNGDSDKDVSVVVDFDDTDNGSRYDEGTSVKVTSFVITEIDDKNGNDESDISTLTNPGAGNTFTLRTEGINTSNFDTTYSSTVDNNGDITSQTFTIGWDVEAVGDDAYIPMTDNRGASTSAGIAFQVEDTANTAYTTGEIASSVAFTSDADQSGSYFLVKKGSKNHFTLEVTAESGTETDYVRVQLLEMNFADTAGSSDVNFDFEPLQDYETLAKLIQA